MGKTIRCRDSGRGWKANLHEGSHACREDADRLPFEICVSSVVYGKKRGLFSRYSRMSVVVVSLIGGRA